MPSTMDYSRFGKIANLLAACDIAPDGPRMVLEASIEETHHHMVNGGNSSAVNAVVTMRELTDGA